MKLRLLLTFVVLAAAAMIARAEDVVGRAIAPWQPGMLDIHQISTGRGNAGLYIFPDGTSLLVDAGELPGPNPQHTPARPDDSRRASQWVVRYIRHALRHDPQPALDYVLLTHFHQDHMGEVASDMPVSHGYPDRRAVWSTERSASCWIEAGPTTPARPGPTVRS